MTSPSEINCPGCGANLGAESPTGEYTCAYCGHVSHARLVQASYGMDWNAIFAQEAAREAQQAERDAQARAARQEESTPSSSSQLPVVLFAVACLLAGAGLELYALADGALAAAVGGALPIALGGLLLLLALRRRPG